MGSLSVDDAVVVVVNLRTLPPVRNAVAESEQKYAALSGGAK